MTKNTINKAFNEMKKSIDTVKSLSSQGSMYTDYESYYERVTFFIQRFTDLLGNALLFELITEANFDYGYSLIESYEAPSFFDFLDEE